MPAKHHLTYLSLYKNKISEPILIVGSKSYDFDTGNFLNHFKTLGFSKVTGIDISPGPGVDEVVDVCEPNSSFVKKQAGVYKTIICMQVLYATEDPFQAARNICD